MFSTDDTIVAVATPPGTAGIGVVRISGPRSRGVAGAILDCAGTLRPRHATLARARGVDQVIATLFVAPHSYTAQDVVEISAHGSPVVLRSIVEAAIAAGARLAEPGEFTLRAFLNGRLDLVQSEAVADLVDAATPLQARTAFDQLEGTLTRRITDLHDGLFDVIARLEASLDFPDEGYHFIEPSDVEGLLATVVGRIEILLNDASRGRTIREGGQVVIVGRTNVGKSSIFNKLSGHSRAIVTDVPGTTRDLITERVDVLGVPLTLVDTAGVRTTADVIEREGVARARQAADTATLLLVVLDQSEQLRGDDVALLKASRTRHRLIVCNKSDCPPAWGAAEIARRAGDAQHLAVSAITDDGIETLREMIVQAVTGHEDLRDTPAISNVRHVALLEQARQHIVHAADAVKQGSNTPEEFILADLQQARAALEEITGARTTDDLLQHIFERFCIGK